MWLKPLFWATSTMRSTSLNCWDGVTDFGTSLSSRPTWTIAGPLFSFVRGSAVRGQAAAGPAAVDLEDHAADVARLGRREIEDGVGELLGPADPLHRDPVEVALERGPAARDHGLLHLGGEGPGGDRVHPDAVGAPFGGQRADQAVDARFRGAVGGPRGDTLVCRDRGQHRDAAAVDEERSGHLRADERGLEVDVEHPVPLRERIADRLAGRADPGVEDDGLQPAAQLGRSLAG